MKVEEVSVLFVEEKPVVAEKAVAAELEANVLGPVKSKFSCFGLLEFVSNLMGLRNLTLNYNCCVMRLI